MPDVIDVLEHDHRLVERLFEEYRSSHDAEVAEQLCEQLTVHTEAEEKLLYPVLGRDVEDGKELEQEARHEHDEVDTLIERVRATGFDGDAVPELISSMQAAVEHHVEEEESEIFPKLRATLEPRRLDDLAAQVERFKSKSSAGDDGQRSSSSRGSRSNGGTGGDGPTKQELYEQARSRGIKGRSTMTKGELAQALHRTHKAS